LLNNHAHTLILLGRAHEAVPMLVRVTKLPGGRTPLVLGTLAEALARLGFDTEARAVFGEAVRLSDHGDATAWKNLALHAADVGLDEEAVEFFVQHLRLAHGETADRAAADVLAAHRQEVMELPDGVPDLSRVLRKALAFEQAIWPPSSGHGDDPPDGEDPSCGVYDHTRASRLRANTAVLTDDKNG
jgi:tetratricopeptide (TPR) repeat protein